MGKLHARFYSQMPQVKLVGIYDCNTEVAEDAAAQFNTKAFKSLDELLKQVAAATIAVPTVSHPAVAKQCMDLSWQDRQVDRIICEECAVAFAETNGLQQRTIAR